MVESDGGYSVGKIGWIGWIRIGQCGISAGGPDMYKNIFTARVGIHIEIQIQIDQTIPIQWIC